MKWKVLLLSAGFIFISILTQAQILSNIGYDEYLVLIQEPKNEALSHLDDLYEDFNSGKYEDEQVYVIVIILDDDGKWEQVFMEVDSWEGELIAGILASEMGVVEGPPVGTAFIFEEEKVIDWLIIYEDGSEAGNYINRFLQTRQ